MCFQPIKRPFFGGDLCALPPVTQPATPPPKRPDERVTQVVAALSLFPSDTGTPRRAPSLFTAARSPSTPLTPAPSTPVGPPPSLHAFKAPSKGSETEITSLTTRGICFYLMPPDGSGDFFSYHRLGDHQPSLIPGISNEAIGVKHSLKPLPPKIKKHMKAHYDQISDWIKHPEYSDSFSLVAVHNWDGFLDNPQCNYLVVDHVPDEATTIPAQPWLKLIVEVFQKKGIFVDASEANWRSKGNTLVLVDWGGEQFLGPQTTLAHLRGLIRRTDALFEEAIKDPRLASLLD